MCTVIVFKVALQQIYTHQVHTGRGGQSYFESNFDKKKPKSLNAIALAQVC